MTLRPDLENDPQCWRYVSRRGTVYGYRVSRVYRRTYERYRGPIPAGLVLDHLCGHGWCYNPWHLEPVTYKENNRRAGIFGGDRQVGNALKTHCKRGHPFDEANTYRAPGRPNKRQCRACQREQPRTR